MKKKILSAFITFIMITAMLPMINVSSATTENALYPKRCMGITQGPGGKTSHTGTQAIDDSTPENRNIYAPFTAIIKRVDKSNGRVIIESKSPVKYADGTIDYMTMMFIHCNDVSKLKVGNEIKQGEIFYSEGDAGAGTGIHVHFECGKGKFTGTGIHTTGYKYPKDGGIDTTTINKAIAPWNALYVTKDTKIKQSKGYSWKIASDVVSTVSDPTSSDNSSTSSNGETAGTQRKFIEQQQYDSVPVYYKSQVYVETLAGKTVKVIDWGVDCEIHKPIDNLFVLAKGTISNNSYYKVNYKGSICYVCEDSIALKGSTIKADDGRSFKLGDIIYHGKNHDIVITAIGEYRCTDGCNGRLTTGGFFGLAGVGPKLNTYNEYCTYADACYKDSSTGKEYPLCASKAVYKGKYGTVYVLENVTKNTGSFWASYAGFYVIRNEGYRKITSIDQIQEYAKEWAQKEFDSGKNVVWDYNIYIYTYNDAKRQADSFECVCGGVAYAGGDTAR